MAQAIGEVERLEAAPEPPKPKEKFNWTPWLLLLPGALWLILFFVVPLYSLVATSLYDPDGGVSDRLRDDVGFSNYWTALQEYWQELLRSMLYAGIATVVCLLLGYPLAYAIAFKAGRWRNLMLVLVIAPFFTSFLIRTLAWQLILSDQGIVVDVFQFLHIIGPDGRLAGDAVRRDLRSRLQLPALHGAAAVRRAGEDRPAADRGGR